MGLFRRRSRDERANGDVTRRSGEPAAAPRTFRHQADPATGQLVRADLTPGRAPELAPVPAPPEVTGLVSGTAQLRQQPISAPDWYTTGQTAPHAPPQTAPAQTAPAQTAPSQAAPAQAAPSHTAPAARPAPSAAPTPATPAAAPPARPDEPSTTTGSLPGIVPFPSAGPAAAVHQPDASGPSDTERKLVRAAWDAVSERADEFVRMFYAELFLAMGGEAFAMFPSSMSAQREDFGRALVQWVVTDDPDAMTAQLDQLGADHRKFDVEPRHYDVAATALLNTWRRLAGSAWTDEVEAAVVASYVRLASIMIDGAVRRRDEPASWGATVVSHERKERDFAVLRLQPDAPYSFRPGQYLTVELAGLPKQWRQMSFASAPRPDNTFDIHVRAVNATGVSGALVAHTKPGDRLRLGPPRGNDLVIEPGTTPGGLLGICSGTGAAPITAVVEALAARTECPVVYVFVGGRNAADLHPVAELDRIVAASGHRDRIRVYGVASDDPTFAGFHGRVEDVVPQMHPWAELGLDVIIAGPDSMTAAAVRGLTSHGVPIGRIHFDQYDSTR